MVLRLTAILVLTAFLIACSGGAGDSTSMPTPNPSPMSGEPSIAPNFMGSNKVLFGALISSETADFAPFDERYPYGKDVRPWLAVSARFGAGGNSAGAANL